MATCTNKLYDPTPHICTRTASRAIKLLGGEYVALCSYCARARARKGSKTVKIETVQNVR